MSTTLEGPLQVGGLTLRSRFICAPMEAVSDAAFRRLCWGAGAGLTYTEMIRARGIVRRNRSTLDLIDSHDPATLTGLQLMVTNDRELTDALAVLEELAGTTHPHLRNLVAIDLNFGCPSPDVIRVGAGPALLKRRSKLRLIFEAFRAWQTKTSLPVKQITAKIRLGLHQQEQDHKVFLPVVELANELLDGLTVHARHAKQRSRDLPTWSAIGEARAKARIPLFGNGDVKSRADAERMFRETGCDGVMVARAAIASPWCFRELDGRGPALPSREELDAARRETTELAARFGTKPKFTEFHAELFTRLEAALAGRATETHIPDNQHMG